MSKLNILEQKQIEDLTITIAYDDYCENPRKWDNLGKMVLFHNRYNFSNETDINQKDYNSWNEMEKDIVKKYGASVILPVYLYDHSGLAFSVQSFQGRLPQGHAEFDSGRIGFIFVTKKDIRNEYGKAGKKEIEKAIEVLTNEVKIYEKYANGESYVFIIEDENGKRLENCGGFYSVEDAMREARLSADDLIKQKNLLEIELN